MPRPTHAQSLAQVLDRFEQPFSVRDVLARIHAEQLPISRATTFRHLDHALETGELVRVPHLGSERLYERAGPHHHHAVCPNCETVRDSEFDCTSHGPSEVVLMLRMCQQCAASAA